VPGEDTRGAAPQALLSDAEVVAAVLDGAVDLFGVLIRRHQESLYRLAWSMVRDSDTAADLVQDTFVRAFVGLESCREPARILVWLLTMVRNRCLDHLKERRRSDISLDAAPEMPGAPGADVLATLTARTELERALDALPASLREAFLLRHVEDMSYEDMADVLETTVAGAKMRVSRAREALRQHLVASRSEAAE
jgi:RNA polymerase sigma-70 factor, ECF subfamily